MLVWGALACVSLPSEYQGYELAILDGDGDALVDCDYPDEVPAGEACDCDDESAETFPGADEQCDGVDNDCDGEVDEGVPELDGLFFDADGDGYGDPDAPVLVCPVPTGVAENADDCDDTTADVAPGLAEVCNGVDDDCDGAVDEGLDEVWYVDADDDGVGTDEATLEQCSEPDGYSAVDGDCDDGDGDVFPGAEEVCGDGVDSDCDATTCAYAGEMAAADLVGLYSTGETSRFGMSVTAADRDGGASVAREIIVGAENYDGEGAVFFFRPEFAQTGGTSDDAGKVVTSGLTDSLFGAASFAGDFDSDGREDVVVGAPKKGMVFLFGSGDVSGVASDVAEGWYDASGRVGTSLTGSPEEGWVAAGAGSSNGVHVFDYQAVDDLDVSVVLDADGGDFGTAVAAIDYGSDGVVEVAAGAPSDGDGGATFVLAVDADSFDPSADALAEMTGAGGFGTALAVADLDGDGHDDLAVGAPSAASGSGVVSIHPGPDLGAAEWELEGTGSAFFGAALGSCDVDGDGGLDLLVHADLAEDQAGVVFVFLEPETGHFEDGDADAQVVGAKSGASLGASMWCTEILTGSGNSVVVGSPHWGDDESLRGAAYLFPEIRQ
ncbi:MAG: hypothetical protein GY913_11745 [Proteobacteria bacterium]|nr:hypothetical protein [Pseudomonadota bacterium]MCP4917587.1 hypothetical protein [Pseudomonadota bacterium]